MSRGAKIVAVFAGLCVIGGIIWYFVVAPRQKVAMNLCTGENVSIHTDVGYVNFNQYSLGEVLQYSPWTLAQQEMEVINILPTDMVTETGNEQRLRANFVFNGNVTQSLDAKAKAELAEILAGTTRVVITGYKVQKIKNPLTILHDEMTLNKVLHSSLMGARQYSYLLVSSVVRATDASISQTNESADRNGLVIVAIGSGKFAIKAKCDKDFGFKNAVALYNLIAFRVTSKGELIPELLGTPLPPASGAMIASPIPQSSTGTQGSSAGSSLVRTTRWINSHIGSLTAYQYTRDKIYGSGITRVNSLDVRSCNLNLKRSYEPVAPRAGLKQTELFQGSLSDLEDTKVTRTADGLVLNLRTRSGTISLHVTNFQGKGSSSQDYIVRDIKLLFDQADVDGAKKLSSAFNSVIKFCRNQESLD